MGKQRDLPTGIVAQIQALRQQGLTQTKIAEQLGISQSSVYKALKKKCSKRTNCSGVRKTSARDNKQLRKIAVSNRFKSTSELTDLWNKQTGADVSRSTTYRRLRELGFKSRVPAVKPMLNKKQMEKRLKWAKEHGEWTAEDWQKVVFSDESRFCISFGDQGPRVWRRGGETYNHECVKRSVKFPQSVMVWGCMSARGVGELCFLKKTVNAAVYQDVLETFLIPTVEEQFGEEDFIFQQDLAPAHAAKSTKDWFTKKQLEVLAWPANSPDLNVIENLWAIVKRKIRDRKPTTLDQLKQNIATAWEAEFLPSINPVVGDIKKLYWSPIKANDIRWNFEKFLITADGVPYKRDRDSGMSAQLGCQYLMFVSYLKEYAAGEMGVISVTKACAVYRFVKRFKLLL
ncbi:hypothetical protein NFI96_000743 [Prochilodus magdalenae]|nr:hypothetical protein NFI96_000743 [Prochilodus magdalenae]